MSHAPASIFSLTREDILARKAARDQVEAHINALRLKLDEHDRWFQALALIVPAEFLSGIWQSPVSDEAVPEHRSIWKAAIESAFQKYRRGLAPREIATFIREDGTTEARERLAGNPNGLYAPLSRMVADGQLVKHGERFYRADVYEELAAQGELEDEIEGPMTGSNLFIYNALKENSPLPPRTIIEMMRGSKEFGPRLEANAQYGYSAIQRLVKQGLIERDSSGSYRLASKENGASDVPASDAPEAGLEDETSKLLDGL